MFTTVYSKARKHYPATATDFIHHIVGNGEGMAIAFAHKDGTVTGRAFIIGDTASYDSYNLVYTGTITKITDKAVTIVAYYGTKSATTHKISLHEFCWRNYDFNAEKTDADNADTMMYI